MTEEIKYNKDEKWIPYKQLAETPQQTISRLEQENKQMKSALEEIREYCSRIERGEVIGTQDCLINSIKNIVNYTINEVLGDN